MSTDDRLERLLIEVLDAGTPSRPPDRLEPETLRALRHVRRWPRWLALIKETPMRTSSGLAVGSPMARVAGIVIATLLLALTIAGVGIAGSRLLAADDSIVVDPSGSGDFTTIGEAVAAAVDGDTVLVRPGTYDEAIVIDKDITLRGDGADRSAVVIQVPPDAPLLPEELAGRCLMGCSGTTNQPTGLLLIETMSSLSNLTVVGLAEGSAVSIHGGAPTLEDLVIEIAGDVGRTTQAVPRGGLHIDHASRAVVRGITHHGWLSVDRGSSPIFEDNQLLDSCVHLWGEGTAAELRRNTITGCLNGWALDIAHGATPIIEDNDISVAGVYIYPGIAEGTHPIIRRNRIHDPEASMEIKGIRIDAGATATLEGNEIFGNPSGIHITQTEAMVRENDIHDNDTGLTVDGASPSLEGNTIESNRVGLVISGVSADPRLSGNLICDNEANVNLVGGAELPDTVGNEICEDASE